ncbi:hypothetical protein C1646_773281 [Rhizophagus diaphanus]|nr:hypothetical protein C1646_773281 [Rhizophagus diaphanus] [Rhizophagus sp. MUCL 43196]
MSKLNGDVLYYIFQDLHYLITANSNNERNFKKSLHSCLFVNKHWGKIMIPILWSYPYKYAYNKKSLLDIIISHLSDNSIKFLKDKNIIEANFQKQKLSFNYVRFCKYLKNIEEVIPNKHSLKEEIYKLFISECSSLKCLSSDMMSYSICEYPGSNFSLSNLYELYIRARYSKFYHKLAQICSSIEKIHISIYEETSGIAELIEMQKQIKYIFIDEYPECKKMNQALEKHVNSIVHLDLKINRSFQHDFFLPKLINLQYLRIDDTKRQLVRKHEIYLNYYNLQILDLLRVSLDIAIDIIQNTNGSLWKIKIRLSNCDQAKEYNQSIYKYCPNIKYVTVFLLREGTLEELEKIFVKCQHLVAIDIDEIIRNEYHDKFLDLLVELAPFTLYKIHIDFINLFNEESLKLFFTKWKNRCKKPLYLYHRINLWHKFIKICDVKAIELDYYKDDFWNHEIKWSNE